MPQALVNLGSRFPEKHALVTSIPLIWDLGLKKAVRWVHEKFSPCRDPVHCEERTEFYETLYDHLRVDAPDTGGAKTQLIAKVVKASQAFTNPNIPSV